MLDVRDKKYAICSADGAILAAYSNVEEAKIDYADLIKEGHEGLKVFEVIHTYPFEDNYIVKIMKEIEVVIEPEEESKEAVEEPAEEEVGEKKEPTEEKSEKSEGEGDTKEKAEDEDKKE